MPAAAGCASLAFSGVGTMSRIMCAVAAVLVAAVIQPATANDRSECRQGMGDEKMAARANLLGINPDGPLTTTTTV